MVCLLIWNQILKVEDYHAKHMVYTFFDGFTSPVSGFTDQVPMTVAHTIYLHLKFFTRKLKQLVVSWLAVDQVAPARKAVQRGGESHRS